MKYIVLGIVSVVMLYAFRTNTPVPKKSKQSSELQPKTSSNNQLTIIIQPFIDFKPGEANAVLNEVKKYYGKVLVNKPINFPPNSLNAARTRRRADSIITYLSNHTPSGSRTIGLTHTDISVSKDGKADWGVMGLGFCPGKSCVASTFRLHGNNRYEKLIKVALHELAHTEGLPHCPEPTCLLRDAKGKDHLNEEKAFCASCKKYLLSKGWTLK